MLLVSGCGATRQLQGIDASSTPLSAGVTIAQTRNLVGIGGSEQVFIIANYSGGNPHEDVTGESTFVSSDPSVVTVSPSGVLEVVTAYCDWTLASNPTPGGSPPQVPVIDPTFGPLTVTATFQNQTTTIFVNVNSLAGCPGPTTQS